LRAEKLERGETGVRRGREGIRDTLGMQYWLSLA